MADLFLDTLPYNAHSTASDAPWAGLPVLTRLGDTFASRVAASFLKAIGFAELITASPQAYRELAVELDTHPGKLQCVTRKLATNRLTMPSFKWNAMSAILKQHIPPCIRDMRQGCCPPTFTCAKSLAE